MTTVYTFGGHGSRVIQPGYTFTPGVGITQNAGGGDTGDTNQGGGDGGNTEPTHDTFTYSTDIQNLIDSTRYTPVESITLWNSNDPIDTQNVTFQVLPELNNISTMDQTLGTIDASNSNEFVTSNKTVGDVMMGGYGPIMVPTEYLALGPSNMQYAYINGIADANQTATPLVLIGDDTLLGIMYKGSEPTFDLYDQYGALVGNQNDISTYNITLTAYTATTSQNQGEGDKYNLPSDSPLLPSNPSNGDRYAFVWTYNNSPGYAIYVYYEQETLTGTTWDNYTSSTVEVDSSRLHLADSNFNTANSPSSQGHQEGDIVATDYYPSMNYFNAIYEVRAGAYVQTWDYNLTYFSAGWSRETNGVQFSNIQMPSAPTSCYVYLDPTGMTTESNASFYYGQFSITIVSNDTVAKVIKDILDYNNSNNPSTEIALFKV